MPIETVRVAFVRDTGPTALLDGVVVRAFDTGNNLITIADSGPPNEDGIALLDLEGSLEGTEYQLRFFRAGSRIEPKRILVFSPASAAPTATNDFMVTVQLFELPVATDSKMCRASGMLLGPARMPRRNVTLTFLPKFDAFVDEEAVSMPGRFTSRTDNEGYASVDLYRYGMYEVTIEGREPVTRNIQVPDRANIFLPHLLFPVVVWVSYAEAPPYTMQVGQTLWLTPTVVATDYRKLGAGFEDVRYESSDPTLASVQPLGDRIAIRGIRAGTAFLRASRLDRSIVYLPDFGIQGGDVPIVIAP